MAYLSKNNKKKDNKKKIFFFGVVLFLIASFYFGGLFFLTGPLHYVGKPLWWLKNYSIEVVSNISTTIQTREKLSEENRKLKNELNQINSQLLLHQLLLTENNELKKMLGRGDENQNFVLANILAKPNLSPYDSLILDIGRNHGIKKGDKVVVNNIVIGKIEDVYLKTAKVWLYSFPNETLDVAIGFDKVIGSAEGKGGGNFEVKFPREVPIKKGDVVVLPEMDLFILGTVESILTTPEDSVQTILFRIPINIFELRWVQILQEQ